MRRANRWVRVWVCVMLAAPLACCGGDTGVGEGTDGGGTREMGRVIDVPINIDGADLYETVRTLASPAYAGRAPGTAGGNLARTFLEDRLGAAGFSPRTDGFDIGDGRFGTNLIVRRPGEGALAEEEVLVMAHFDHLGEAPDGGYYAGAVDNAGGVAAALALLSAWPPGDGPHRALTVAFTDAEEIGLKGALALWENGVVPASQLVAAISLDGFGATLGPSHTAGVALGVDTAPALRTAVHDANAASPFAMLPMPAYVLEGRSDHAVFQAHAVPTLHVATGTPPGVYHTTADTIDGVDPDVLTGGAVWTVHFLWALARGPRPAWDRDDAAVCEDTVASFDALLAAAAIDFAGSDLSAAIRIAQRTTARWSETPLDAAMRISCAEQMRSLYGLLGSALEPD